MMVVLTFAGTSLRVGAQPANYRVNQDPSGKNQTEPVICVNPLNPNVLVCAADDQRLGYIGTGYYRSTDAGATWMDGVFTVDGSYDSEGNRSVSFDRAGNVYYAHGSWDDWTSCPTGQFSDNGIYVHKSTNGGQTWIPSVYTITAVGNGGTENHCLHNIPSKEFIEGRKVNI